jgi:type VI secretion system protein VasD
VALTLSALFVIGGCSAHAPAPAPEAAAACKEPDLKIVLRGSDRLNVDESGQALAVVVRVYLLKKTKMLEDAEFDQIWQHDRETLADDVLSADELTLAPKDTKTLHLKHNDDAKYIAAVGLFRKPDGIAWRAIRLTPTVCRGDDAMKKVTVAKEIAIDFWAEDYRIEARQ